MPITNYKYINFFKVITPFYQGDKLKSKIIALSLLISSTYADSSISYNNYIQDPFGRSPSGGGTQVHLINLYEKSGGGTQVIVESQIANQNVWQKWFGDGTYNLQGISAVIDNTKNSTNFAYGANLFAQTGSVAGFSFGGNLAIINPYFSSEINGTTIKQFLPANQVIFPNELFTEYKIPSVFQVDAGWLFIETPWVTSLDSQALQKPTFQGILVNYQMTKDILWTGMALNGYMPISQTGFSGNTLYNKGVDTSTQTPNISSGSPGTYALGIQYGADKQWKANLWGYQFLDYADLLYADTRYRLGQPTGFHMHFAAQAATEGSNGQNNAFSAASYGAPQSNMLGFQYGVYYTWFAFAASYNDVFGNSSAYGSGNMVSPYTYQIGTDPLYTSSLMSGLIEKSAGSAMKLAPSFFAFDKSLTITPSFTQFWTNPYPYSNEWDLALTYDMPHAKGLTLNGFLGYLQQPVPVAGGDMTYAEALISYVY